MVFPFDREAMPFTRGFKMQDMTEIVSLVSLRSLGHVGEKYQCSDSCLTVSADFTSELEKCDSVIIVNNWNKIDYEGLILPRIEEAAKKNKTVIVARDLSGDDYKKTADMVGNIVFLSPPSLNVTDDFDFKENSTPVIAVAGLTAYNEKLEIMLALKDALENRDYRVLLISPRTEAQLFGGESYFKEFFEGGMNETEKVYMFNSYIHALEKVYAPDIIILGIPGAIMTLNPVFSGDFAILSTEIFEAVKPDYLIVSFPYMESDTEGYIYFGEAIRQKYGFPADMYHLSGFMIDNLDSISSRKLSLVSLPEEEVFNAVKAVNFDRLFTYKSRAHLERCAEDIIRKLTGDYIEIV